LSEEDLMSNGKIPKAIFSGLIIFSIILLVSGCARWPDGPGPGPGGTNYQLKITVKVAGKINTTFANAGIYYIALDTDNDSVNGPAGDLSLWGDYYYIKLENGFPYFVKLKDGVESTLNGGSVSFDGNQLQATIALSDLGDPKSIDINVVTTDSDNYTYDSLDNYFSISTNLLSSEERTDWEGDSGAGGVDFDIVQVNAEIFTY
jgi:hypothetical protein